MEERWEAASRAAGLEASSLAYPYIRVVSYFAVTE